MPADELANIDIFSGIRLSIRLSFTIFTVLAESSSISIRLALALLAYSDLVPCKKNISFLLLVKRLMIVFSLFLLPFLYIFISGTQRERKLLNSFSSP